MLPPGGENGMVSREYVFLPGSMRTFLHAHQCGAVLGGTELVPRETGQSPRGAAGTRQGGARDSLTGSFCVGPFLSSERWRSASEEAQ